MAEESPLTIAAEREAPETASTADRPNILLVEDNPDVIALDGGGIGLLSIVAVLGASASVVAVAFRAIVLPDPAAELSRQLGIYLAVVGCLVALAGAAVQLMVSDTAPRLPGRFGKR